MTRPQRLSRPAAEAIRRQGSQDGHLPPDFAGDPFDRVIAATAIVDRLPLVTSDERIRASRVVKTIW